jgi:hypothetical protein
MAWYLYRFTKSVNSVILEMSAILLACDEASRQRDSRTSLILLRNKNFVVLDV